MAHFPTMHKRKLSGPAALFGYSSSSVQYTSDEVNRMLLI